MSAIKRFYTSILYGNKFIAIVRIFLGMMFIFSGIFKAIDPYSFSKVIILYKIIPEIVVPYAAIVVPYVELMVGSLLIIGFRIRSVSFISILLMIVFTIAITVNVIRGESFDCGCFELSRFGINEDVSVKLIIRDIVILVVFYIIFSAEKHFFSLDNTLEKDELTHL